MEKLITIILLLTILPNCNMNNANSEDKNGSVDTSAIEMTASEFNGPQIPINYDFEKLHLTLNSSISNDEAAEFWVWDHMNARGGFPDSSGIDFYMNLNQPLFSYRGLETLPSLSIKTDKNIIIEFSATILFELENHEPESILDVLDSLTQIDLLQDKQVREILVENGAYIIETENSIESVHLRLKDNPYGYDRVNYQIRLKSDVDPSTAGLSQNNTTITPEFRSELKPGEALKLNEVYCDTVNYKSFDDDYDNWLLLVESNEGIVALITNEVHDFDEGDMIRIEWKIGKMVNAGDSEISEFREYLVSAIKL